MTTFTLTMLVIGHRRFQPAQDLAYDPSPWCMWKWCSYLFQMNFFWNIIISSCFWGFMLPTGSYIEYTGTPNLEVKFAMDHSLPLLYLTIDWALNGISFEWSHIWPNLAIMGFYGLVNFSFVEITGEMIYPVLTWDSWQAWVAALGLVFIVIVF